MFLFKIGLITLFCVLYCLGGQGLRWAKKWVGPSILGVSLIGIAYFDHVLNWLVLIGSLAYLGAANGFAYGDNFTHGKTSLKILFRGLCGASYGVCGLLISLGTGNLFTGFAQLALATSASIIFGVLNPFSKLGNKGVMLEDLCISFCYVSTVYFLV